VSGLSDRGGWASTELVLLLAGEARGGSGCEVWTAQRDVMRYGQGSENRGVLERRKIAI
jgi:hypothetical protein